MFSPVSLTCTLCRIFEKIISNEIIKFLNSKNFFTIEQYGFLKNRSTTTQLLTAAEDYYDAIQNNKCIDSIY